MTTENTTYTKHNLANTPYDKVFSTIYPYTVHKLDLEAVIPEATERPKLKQSKVIFRSDGLEMNTVGSDFEVVQAEEMTETFREVFESDLFEITNGGQFKDGSGMYLNAKVRGSENEVIKNDSVYGALTFFKGFDGNMPIGVSFKIGRPICTNTLSVVLRERLASEGIRTFKIASTNENTLFTAKHTKNVRVKLEQGKQWANRVMNDISTSIEAFKKLADTRMTKTQQENYLFEIITGKKPAEVKSIDDISTKTQNTLRHVIDLLDTQRGIELVPAIRGTAWQAYNAVTDYLTHDYGRTEDSRFAAQHFGTSAKMNNKALALALTH